MKIILSLEESKTSVMIITGLITDLLRNRKCTGFGITLSQFFQDTSKAITLTEEQIRLLDAFTSLSVEKKAFCLKLIEEIKELP